MQTDDQVKALVKQDQELENEINQLEKEKEQVQQQKLIAENEKDRLQGHEVWKLEKDLTEKKKEFVTLNEDLQALNVKWDSKKKLHSRDWREREQIQEELRKQETVVKDVLEELHLDAEEAAFPLHEVNVNDFERQKEDEFDFTVWIQEAGNHDRLLTSLKQLAEEEARLSEEHLRLGRLSSEKKQEIDELRKEQDHLEQWFTEQKQQLEHEVFSWIEHHPKLLFSNERLQEIARSLQGLYEVNRYDDVREQLFTAINDYVAEMKTEKNLTEKRKVTKEQEIEIVKDELHQWKTMKIANPERAKDTEEFRKKLHDKNQSYVPFYAAVEFQDHVTDEQKERLESALNHIGLLDSLITDQQILPTHDRVIQKEPLILKPTLADYLRPDLDEDSLISNHHVDEVLRSIPLKQEGTRFHVDVDGTYSIGCLVGHAPNQGPSKYIGRSSRKRYQQEKIHECEQQLRELHVELETIKHQLLQVEDELQNADEWKRKIPSDKVLSELNVDIETNDHRLKQQQKTLLEVDNQWKKVHQQIQMIKLKLHQQGSQLNLTLTRESIGQALQAANRYRDHVHELRGAFQKCLFSRQRIEDLHSRIQEKEEEMDEIKGEQNVKNSQLFQTKAEINSIEQQLKLKGIDEVRARIQEVQLLLADAEKRMEHIQETLPQKRVNRDTCEKELEGAKTSAEFWSNMAAEWGKIVKGEVARGFIEIDKINPSAILTQLEAIVAKYDRSKLNEQLTKVFFNEQLHLTEYRMFEYTEEAERPDWFSIERGDYYEPFKNEWNQLRGRRIIQMEYHGQRVSPYYVLKSLEKELEDQKGWLDEQDRQLYEDIIVNTVGIILRNRIHRAEKWVREMNKIMESRDNSSGLTFSIAWKPLTAESEQELDTKDLVELLQRNSKFLNEEDLNRITKHFQSRIEKAKELIQLRNEGSTLHQVLKEVLDYRKWFTFVLSFKRVNEPKRELTNNAFFKFSGGEKAMAMYIPLFTAAYSRYKEAGDMAPFIISLDEAFAGVDENNIRDMFEVVEQLGFSYIMNSQALWGDYDTISNLSICELVRPKNADFVTVIRYQWDGKKRTLVFDKEPVQELVTNE
ncbi:TIGR02680 family protein [uncultured Metabacillus sp.]|uniref:TIGR02680 family protein n=1 Tax=uncultured Metabacillus sp. TaxID=2860135 RepID=UPI00261BAC18|nr:TIGR02680 family protein [uncultured Metabacillus sp.]